ncbi:ABC transporter ATP-binding protein/permease [Brevibacillus laterosporus]|nr:ABC transporter ATP-binding protein/permease [Brevibacillus laterosporus]TPG68144.1 ABC transporter ATP-binding protein/permease [Brevibacillus laterosporus]TPG88843.1 ABC transporter ATP-binding protein/permease [Brevibacillus laterosporus]
MNLLEVKNINKSYTIYKKEKTKILHDVNLSFNKGEFVSILGESGCGKSTLMNIIGGMDSDFGGEVLVEGTNLKNMKEHELDDYRKSKIGFVFQSFNLIPHLSVLENVTIVMQMASKSEKERNERAKDLLTEVGLKEHMMKKPNQLSGGQKQRVAIARALANEPEILLADEPTGALDKETSQQILELLDNIAKKGKLVITVTHSQKVADSGSRIVKIDDGKVIEDINLKDSYQAKETSPQVKSKSLSLASSFKLALKNMKLNAKRNILVALGGSIGILSVILMLSLGSGVTNYINEEINSSMNPLMVEITKKGEENNDTGNSMPMLGAKEPFNEEDIEQIKNIEHVNSVEKVTSFNMKSSAGLGDKRSDIMQFSTMTDSIKKENVEKGHLPGENEVLLTPSLAKALSSNENYKSLIGKEISVYVTEIGIDNKPVTIENKLKVSGIYKAESMGPQGTTMAYVKYETLENAYAKQGLTLSPTQINAFADKQEQVDAIKTKLENDGFESSQMAEMLKKVTSYLDMATVLLAGIAGISLIVSGIMILVVLYISVVERTKEIGILRAVGARKKDIKRIFFSESALLGLFSGLIAVIVATVISVIGNSILSNSFGAELINLTGQNVFFGIAVSMIVSIIAGIMPSSKAAKLDPMESLRFE